MQLKHFKMLFKAYGEETMKKSNVFTWHKGFKESSHVEITNEDNVHHFLDIKGTVHFKFIPQG